MKYFFLLFILSFLIIFMGCKNKKINNWEIELPETKIRSDLDQWAFVKYDYPKLRKEPKVNSEIINYLQKGKLIKIIKKNTKLVTFNNEINYWYFVDYDGEKGWIFGSFIVIFNSLEEAELKCKEMLLGELNDKEIQ